MVNTVLGSTLMNLISACFLKSFFYLSGGVRLGLPSGAEPWKDSNKKEIQLWESMISHLGIMAEYTIPLRKTMTSVKK